MLYWSLAAKQLAGQVNRDSSAGHLCGICGQKGWLVDRICWQISPLFGNTNVASSSGS